MRVVLATNVLNSAFISEKGIPALAIDLWFEGRYELVTSTWQIEEFRRTTRYERVRSRIVPALVGRFVNLIRDHALIVSPLPSINISNDPDDNFILATAIAGNADYIVSGDKGDLLSLEKVEGIPIITARTFVEMFEKL